MARRWRRRRVRRQPLPQSAYGPPLSCRLASCAELRQDWQQRRACRRRRPREPACRPVRRSLDWRRQSPEEWTRVRRAFGSDAGVPSEAEGRSVKQPICGSVGESTRSAGVRSPNLRHMRLSVRVDGPGRYVFRPLCDLPWPIRACQVAAGGPSHDRGEAAAPGQGFPGWKRSGARRSAHDRWRSRTSKRSRLSDSKRKGRRWAQSGAGKRSTVSRCSVTAPGLGGGKQRGARLARKLSRSRRAPKKTRRSWRSSLAPGTLHCHNCLSTKAFLPDHRSPLSCLFELISPPFFGFFFGLQLQPRAAPPLAQAAAALGSAAPVAASTRSCTVAHLLESMVSSPMGRRTNLR